MQFDNKLVWSINVGSLRQNIMHMSIKNTIILRPQIADSNFANKTRFSIIFIIITKTLGKKIRFMPFRVMGTIKQFHKSSLFFLSVNEIKVVLIIYCLLLVYVFNLKVYRFK